MPETLAVVPIFVNAGAAVLPALVGGLASVLSLMLRPRELLRACRRRPWRALTVVIALAGIGSGITWLVLAPAAPAAQANVAAPERVDWARVAMDIIRREKFGSLGATTASAGGSGPYVLGRDFSRCNSDGAAGPANLTPLWDYPSKDMMFLSSPAVVNGKVYVASAAMDLSGKYGFVACLDADTGRKLWLTSMCGDESFKPFFSSPAVSADGKSVLIGQGLHDDADCSLLCLDAATGKVRWQLATPLHLESSPAVRGDMVVIGAGAIEGGDRKPTGHAGFVLAARISDGKELWRYDLADPEGDPAIDEDGTVYIGSGFNGSAVVALRSQTDEQLKTAGQARLLWRRAAPYPVTSAVSLCGELVVVSGGNGDYVYSAAEPAGVVMALNRRTGEVVWQRTFQDSVLGSSACCEKPSGGPACRGGVVVSPGRNGEVIAMDLADGSVLWRQRISGKSAVLAGVALADGRVYGVSCDGYLGVLDARDGKLIEKHILNDESKGGPNGLSVSSPAVAGGRVFVGSETGGVRCFVGPTGPTKF